jgi:hypothetical protein
VTSPRTATPPLTVGGNTTTTFSVQGGGPVVEADSACEKNGNHCWHDSNITLTYYPGAAVEHCCFCNAKHHRPLGRPTIELGHGPFAGGSTLSVRVATSEKESNG